jgi:TolB-like protein
MKPSCRSRASARACAIGLAVAALEFAGCSLFSPTPRASPAAAPILADRSIAVLPFANLSDDQANDAFCAGLRDAIVTHLTKVQDLRVISGRVPLPDKGARKTVTEIAQELGVTFIFEGSMRQAGNRVRVSGRLVHAATNEQVWTSSYDREFTPHGVNALQTILALEMAGAIRTVVAPETK